MSWYRDMHGRQPVLAAQGTAMLAVLLLCLAAMSFDARLINGLSVWIKPAKFAASFVLWFWTLAWLWPALAPAARQGLVARACVAVMLVCAWFEMAYILARGALGLASHFATADLFGAVMFTLMGIGATLLVLAVAVLGLLVLLHPNPAMPALPRLAAGWGLLLTGLLGGAAGWAVAVNGGPWVGGTPGYAGTWPPFFWSRTAGDLRVAHFFGLHAMQALPLAAWAAGRWWPGRAGPAWVAASLAWGLLAVATLGQALLGRPFPV